MAQKPMEREKNHFPIAMTVMVAIFSLFIGAPHGEYARAAQQTSVFDMPLEELLNMEVSTPSKKSEKTTDAPGIITIISAEEIERFGAVNLLEVLERVPGAYVAADNAFPKGNVGIRGDITPEVNNHMLLLLNGRPIRESTHGAMNTTVYTAFPLSAIEKIEIVRGPGSVLYGTNAYSGVINIFTKGKDSTTANAMAGMGSYSTKTLEATGSYVKNDYYLAGGIRHLKSDNVQEYDDDFHLTGDYNPDEDLIGVTLNAGYKGLTFTSFLGGNKIRRDEHPDALHSGNIFDTQTIAADIGYTHALSSWWDMAVNATLNDLDNEWETFHEEATDYVFELTNYFSPGDHTNILAGGSVYILTGSGVKGDLRHIPHYDETRYNAYIQIDIRPVDQLKLIAGGQFNKVEDVDPDFVPRFGAIYNFTPEWGTKLLYGSAFRSPFAVERTIDLPGAAGLIGSKKLKPEKITTIDFQVFYATPRIQCAATYFRSKQKDLIAIYANETGTGLVFENESEVSARGLELESQIKPTDQLYLTGSMVYIERMNDEDKRDRTIVPSTMIKLGISYDITQALSLGLFHSFYSKPQPLREIIPTTIYNHPDAEKLNYLTAQLSFNITRMMKLSHLPSIQLRLYGNNLLNEEIFIPNSRTWENTIPRQTGRTYYGAVTITL